MCDVKGFLSLHPLKLLVLEEHCTMTRRRPESAKALKQVGRTCYSYPFSFFPMFAPILGDRKR